MKKKPQPRCQRRRCRPAWHPITTSTSFTSKSCTTIALSESVGMLTRSKNVTSSFHKPRRISRRSKTRNSNCKIQRSQSSSQVLVALRECLSEMRQASRPRCAAQLNSWPQISTTAHSTPQGKTTKKNRSSGCRHIAPSFMTLRCLQRRPWSLNRRKKS